MTCREIRSLEHCTTICGLSSGREHNHKYFQWVSHVFVDPTSDLSCAAINHMFYLMVAFWDMVGDLRILWQREVACQVAR